MTAPPDGPGGPPPGPIVTPAGELVLRTVRLDEDLDLLTGWMNDPDTDRWWALAGPPGTTAAHVAGQLDGDGRSRPVIALLDGRPTGYFELYRADLDPLAAHYPARPYDLGVHLLLAPAARGRRLAAPLLDAIAARLLRDELRCTRVLAEPDVRNTPSVRAFAAAGFTRVADLELPDKRAALMIRPRPET
ncbi:GNAT family N-acetyltransferase [Kitasatospora cheerisanensis]|uniref:Lysine N-acyltransferase MbtK n=1 Tax=Kitasatospora cheerisanensis KCTC 2395 TaxID=1348663 RepID=A0A066YNT8_9ACTN|nr:GNAT family N-acetyltransferase [Kitasatospora cheerisanensis]KDN82907.1 N-acetyltransferase GCN5 [Kitasatospora cheerisanensis KCTC 2395]